MVKFKVLRFFYLNTFLNSAAGKTITSGDLNNLLNENWYNISSYAVSNRPPGEILGKLFVQKMMNGYRQLYFQDLNNTIYSRIYYPLEQNPLWSNWEKIYPDYTQEIMSGFDTTGYIHFSNRLIVQWIFSKQGSQPANVLTKIFTEEYPINCTNAISLILLREEYSNRERTINLDWTYITENNVTYQVTTSETPAGTLESYYIGYYRNIVIIGYI